MGQTLAEEPAPAPAAPAQTTAQDPHEWLEDVTGDRSLDWVRARNKSTVETLAETESFKKLEQRLLSILDSKERIPNVYKMGPHYYNFWRDAAQPRGVWRRTSLDEFRKKAPKWETVLDLDALGTKENENWVWSYADCLKPKYERCLVALSRGGADATVIREYDLAKKAFVDGGFSVPEAKTSISWKDQDTVFIGTEFDDDAMTESGYPRVAKLWRRGTPMAEAVTVYEGKKSDLGVFAGRDFTTGHERDVITKAITFFTNETLLLKDGKSVRIDKPDSANASFWREWLLIDLREDWDLGEVTWPAGALLAINADEFLAGKRNFQSLYTPSKTKSLAGFTGTRHHVIVNELDMVKNRLYVLTPKDGKWQRAPLAGAPAMGTVSASPIDADESDAYFMTVTDYLTPTSLYLGDVDSDEPELLKSLPSFFDTKGLTVAQHLAKSDDGTEVPYFVVHKKGLELDGSHPTLLYGYGGFEVSEVPAYRASVGAAWLEQGGVFAVANIRGGGEFGPTWHQAALKSKRHKAYEDMASVAKDLAARKITSAKHLGVQGGSNGGLLTGNMLSTYPELFGAIVIQVPLLDMLRYHKLLAGASWMGEYGNPEDPEEAVFLRKYSPYHQVSADRKYPPVLLTTSTRDDRVHPGHARKLMAKLMEQEHTAYYYENIEGGHGGAADNKQSAFMQALAYAFLWKELAPAE